MTEPGRAPELDCRPSAGLTNQPWQWIFQKQWPLDVDTPYHNVIHQPWVVDVDQDDTAEVVLIAADDLTKVL